MCLYWPSLLSTQSQPGLNRTCWLIGFLKHLCLLYSSKRAESSRHFQIYQNSKRKKTDSWTGGGESMAKHCLKRIWVVGDSLLSCGLMYLRPGGFVNTHSLLIGLVPRNPKSTRWRFRFSSVLPHWLMSNWMPSRYVPPCLSPVPVSLVSLVQVSIFYKVTGQSGLGFTLRLV